MKKFIRKSLLIAAVFTAVVAKGKELDNSLNFKLIGEKVLNLSFKNSDGTLEIRVKDTNDESFYRETFKGKVFSKKYDLSTLPNGSYYFEIEGETKITVTEFTVNANAIAFNVESESVYLKPIVRRDGNSVFISKVALNKAPLEIEMYQNEELIYREELSGDTCLGRILNIEKLVKGTYKLILSSNNQEFVEYIYK